MTVILNKIISTFMAVICSVVFLSGVKSAEKVVLSAMGNNNECIWGVKK